MALVVLSGKGHRRTLMSMYTQILDAALDERRLPAVAPTAAEALAALLRCHTDWAQATHWKRRLGLEFNRPGEPGGLRHCPHRLARCVGIACDPDTFDQPVRQRNEFKNENWNLAASVWMNSINGSTTPWSRTEASSGAGAVNSVMLG